MAMLLRTVIEKAELFFGAWEMGKQRVLNMS